MERLFRLVTRKAPPRNEIALPTTEASTLVQVSPAVVFEKRVSEISDEERNQWESSYLGKDIFGKREYLLSLSLQDDPAKRIYAALGTNDLGVEIDIPLTDPTPQEELVSDAYLKTTFFGELDLEKYRGYATDTFNKNGLLAFLNRHAAGVAPDDVPDWFYENFGVTHLDRYGSVYIGSHGGSGEYGYDFNATISPRDRRSNPVMRDESGTDSILRANSFIQVVRESLPDVNVEPLSVDTYLQDVQTTLLFLPQDWVA